MINYISTLMDGILTPLLSLPHILAIIIITFFMSLMITLIYKKMTDQVLMKSLKEELKKHQKQLKENKDNTDKLLELQKKAMDTNMQYLLHSLKPTLLTMLPVLLVFGWLSTHYGYEAIQPGQNFDLTVFTKQGVTGNFILEAPEGIIVDQTEKPIVKNKASWKLKGKNGDYLLKLRTDNVEYEKEIIIANEQRYATPEKVINDNFVEKIELSMRNLVILRIFGYGIGWIGTYILFSIIFSLSLRKLLDVQ